MSSLSINSLPNKSCKQTINLSLDRISVTLYSPQLCSAINHYKEGKQAYTQWTPKQITEYIKQRMDVLKNVHQIEEKREYLKRDKKSVPGYHVKLANGILSHEYSDTTIRIYAWHPFLIMFYPNFNRYLTRYCEKNGLDYKHPEGHDNAFEQISIPRSRFLKMGLDSMNLEELQTKIIIPAIRELFPDLANYYINGKIIYNQVEVCIDSVLNSKDKAINTLMEWSTTNITMFNDSKLRWKNGSPFFTANMDKLRFKGYVKNRIIRFELTYDTGYMEDAHIQRRDLHEIVADAKNKFIQISKMTNCVKVTKSFPDLSNLRKINRIIRTEKDLEALRSLQSLSNQSFRNKEIQDMTSLNRNQVYYRISEKLIWMLNKTSKAKYVLKPFAIQIIKLILKMLHETEFLIQHFLDKYADDTSIDILGAHNPSYFGRETSVFEFVT